MSSFAPITLNISDAERELAEFKALLDSKDELSKRDDILNKLSSWRNMLCGLGTLDVHLGLPNRMALEYDLSGRFSCDLVLGHSGRLRYLFVEFEGASKNSIFKNSSGRRSKKLGDSFNAGLGQLLEWFWWNKKSPDIDLLRQQFGGSYIANVGALVLGRDSFVNADPLDRNRWDWIKAEFTTFPVTFFMTYDEMYAHLARQIASWKEDIKASAKCS